MTMATNAPMQREPTEGKVTRKVEERTARVPSLGYFGLAIGSMVASAILMSRREESLANFVGHWAPALLVIGVYNKLVKIEHELLEQRSL